MDLKIIDFGLSKMLVKEDKININISLDFTSFDKLRAFLSGSPSLGCRTNRHFTISGFSRFYMHISKLSFHILFSIGIELTNLGRVGHLFGLLSSTRRTVIRLCLLQYDPVTL